MTSRRGKRHHRNVQKPNTAKGAQKGNHPPPEGAKMPGTPLMSENINFETPNGTNGPGNQNGNPEQGNNDRSLVRLTAGLLFVGFITFLVLVVHAYIFFQSDETQRAAQRPWVEFAQLEIIDPITCDRGAGKTKVKFQLRNSGNSPALHVISKLAISFDIRDISSATPQKKICQSLEDAPVEVANPGRAVFPGLDHTEEVVDLPARIPGFGPWVIYPTIFACTDFRLVMGKVTKPELSGVWN